MGRCATWLATAALLGGCTHDWERYEGPVGGAPNTGGSSAGNGGDGDGGAGGMLTPAQRDACVAYCDKHESCGTGPANCEEECASKIVNCDQLAVVNSAIAACPGCLTTPDACISSAGQDCF